MQSVTTDLGVSNCLTQTGKTSTLYLRSFDRSPLKEEKRQIKHKTQRISALNNALNNTEAIGINKNLQATALSMMIKSEINFAVVLAVQSSEPIFCHQNTQSGLTNRPNIHRMRGFSIVCVPIVQRPRTPGFHPGNRGSTPLGDANCESLLSNQ